MTVKTMDDLFAETLKDIYYAEKHILKALPGMVRKASSEKLKRALEDHRQETEGQIDRIEQVFKLIDMPARGKKCEAIEGILAEAKEHMEDIKDPEVLDAGMIGSAQAVEHYEITRYGTLIARPAAERDRRGVGERARGGVSNDAPGLDAVIPVPVADSGTRSGTRGVAAQKSRRQLGHRRRLGTRR
jgi:ferritin-like metal-binding protein YciE